MTANRWPALPYDEWKGTYATLHMWVQMAGKVALALAPPLNHSWGIAFHLTTRGMTSAVLPHPDRPFTIEFDFIDHQLRIRPARGGAGAIGLRPQTVAEFYRSLVRVMGDMALDTRIWPMPVEIPDPIRFDEDTVHAEYDPEQARRAWRVLLEASLVLNQTRAEFIGKTSPAHFFWGAFDLAVTRFSGRPAPPRDGPAWMREAYSHEVISHGFWPGGDALPEPIFYGYAAPEPAGFRESRVEPGGAYYHAALGEFVLPYEAVRLSSDPEATLRAFVRSTYEAGATLGGWDRKALERTG